MAPLSAWACVGLLLLSSPSCEALHANREANRIVQKARASVRSDDVSSEQLTKAFSQRCGSSCQELWDNMTAAPSVETGRNLTSHASQARHYGYLVALATLAQQQFESVKAKHVYDLVPQAQPRPMVLKARSSSSGSLDDTACASSADCQLKRLTANKCNYGREALQKSYQSINVMAHTLGSAVSILCGCLFVSEQATCALQSIPPVCIFPYTVYSQLFSGSIEIWEAVKAATRSCMIHGDAAVSS